MKWILLFLMSLIFGSFADKPNVIIIFTDDQGYNDLGCFGSEKIKTPNIDRMAAEGRRFTSFYVSSSICTPSRASLMTGCYAKRVGLQQGVIHPPHTYGLNPEETTLAEMFKNAGYSTGMVGKWHLGHLPELLPMKQGFDFFYGSPYSNDMPLSKYLKLSKNVVFRKGITRDNMLENKKGHEFKGVLMRGDEVLEFPADQALFSQRYTREALAFIDANKDQPFFLYLAHSMPHLPVAASKNFKDRSAYGLYGDTIEEIDWSAGEILNRLRDLKLDSKTLIIYTSDNGPWHLYNNGNPPIGETGCALPLREGKAMPWEGGLRVPAVMWAPGRIPAGTVCDEMATTMDLYPTLAKLSGGKLPNHEVDGFDISDLLFTASPKQSPRETMLYYSTNGKIIGLRRGAFKLLVHNKSTMEKHKKTNDGKLPDPVELFNLIDDVSETRNLATSHSEMVKEMEQTMRAMDREIQSNQRARWERPKAYQ